MKYVWFDAPCLMFFKKFKTTSEQSFVDFIKDYYRLNV